MLRRAWLLLFVLGTACASVQPVPVAPPREIGAGFRYSAYGPPYDPGPEYWALVGMEMARRFDNAHPETIWIVSRLHGQGTLLNFPAKAKDPLITGSPLDENEETLDLFDRAGVRVWLQIEPGFASVDELIELILERYKHHPSVIGFGLDVEWYRSNNPDEGQAVTDEEAKRWLSAIRRHNPQYRLFLKHFALNKMPPTARDGILFVDGIRRHPRRRHASPSRLHDRSPGSGTREAGRPPAAGRDRSSRNEATCGVGSADDRSLGRVQGSGLLALGSWEAADSPEPRAQSPEP